MTLSVALGVLYLKFLTPKRYDIAGVFALVVWSHWWLDLIVHRPDLHVFNDNYQGWGLWRLGVASLIIELGLFAIAMATYLIRTVQLPQTLFSDKSFAEKYKLDSVWLFAGSLILIQILFSFIPPFKPEWFFLVCFAMLISLVPLLSWLVDVRRGASYRGATYLPQEK
jgi:H+/Cl- antiporter ClcA